MRGNIPPSSLHNILTNETNVSKTSNYLINFRDAVFPFLSFIRTT